MADVVAFTERGRTVVERPRAGDGDRGRWLPEVGVRCGGKRSFERGDMEVGEACERWGGGGVLGRWNGRVGDGERRESGREVREGGATWFRGVEPAEALGEEAEGGEGGGVEWRGAGGRSGECDW